MIKGILFDFNGTLFYDSDKNVLAFQRFFMKRGIEPPSEATIVKRAFGKSNSDIFRDIFDPNATDEEIVEYALEKEQLYREACRSDPASMHLAKGACEMLDHLKKKGIPFNLATGSPIDNVEFYFDELGIGRWFDINKIVYSDDTLPGKPAPDFYIEAAKRIGLSANECIVFEDAVSGILSANRANAGAVYALISDDLSLDRSDLKIDGEIKNFENYGSILSCFGL